MADAAPYDPVVELRSTSLGATASALAIAAVAWVGLILNLMTSVGNTGSLATSIWILLRFFTIVTNLLVAVVFTGLAARRQGFAHPALVAALALAILLVGIVYKLLLEDLYHLQGLARLADVLLHRVTPVLVPLFWLLFTPKGRLRFRDPLLWALYPLAYFVYALGRAAFDDRYPYPFMDVGRIGWLQTGINALAIALGFALTGLALVWLDRRLGRRRTGER